VGAEHFTGQTHPPNLEEPMTTIDPTTSIALAAALLEAIARDSEQAVDFDVPLRCGQAASRLHTVLGFSPTQLPFVGDDATDIRTALGEALTLLSGLAEDQITDPILDALLDVRAAEAAVPEDAVQ
jgi:hypothetical protein